MLTSRNSEGKWQKALTHHPVEKLNSIRICSREPGQQILVEQHLVGISGDPTTIHNGNERDTFFRHLPQCPGQILYLAPLYASDTGKSVWVPLLHWFSSAPLVNSFLPKKVWILLKASFLHLRSNFLAVFLNFFLHKLTVKRAIFKQSRCTSPDHHKQCIW